MEAAAAPAGQLPVARHRLPRVELGWAGWLLLCLLAGGGGGLLLVANEQLAVSLVLAAAGAVVLSRWPLLALAALLVLAARPSPIRDLVWFCTLTGGAALVIWRIPRLPGRLFLLPLALFLLVSLPRLNWSEPLFGPGLRRAYELPVIHYEYLRLPQEEATNWLHLALVLVAAAFAARHLRSEGRLRLAVAALLVGGAFPIWRGTEQLLSGTFVTRGGFASVQGTFEFPNAFGIWLVLFLLVAIVALIEFRSTLARVALVVLIAAAAVNLLHTYTRAAWIGFAFGLVLLSVLRYRRLLVVGLVALVLAAVGFPTAVDSVQARFGDLTSQNAANAKNSLTWRRGQWKAMSHWGADAPLFGQGFGSYRRLTIKEFGFEAHTYGTLGTVNGQLNVGFTAHNDFVKSWVEGGVVGLVLWAAVLLGLALSLVYALRVPAVAPWAAALLSTEVGVVTMSFSDNVQAYTVALLCLMVLSAATAAAAKAARSSPASRSIS